MNDRGAAVVVEDDADIRGLLATLLTQSGFEVHEAGTGLDGMRLVSAHDPVLVTVDIGLPDIDGFEVTRRVRKISDAYIIMLTAMTEEIDTLMGLDAGADDYLTKPFRPRELRARVEALLRRPRTGRSSSQPDTDATDGLDDGTAALRHERVEQARPPRYMSVDDGSPTTAERFHYHLDGLRVYPNLYRVTVDADDVPLTRTQFVLLTTLMTSRRLVRSKAELFRILRDEDPTADTFVGEADERTIEVHIGNLRRQLGDDVRQPRWIQTIRGFGYRLVGSPQAVD